MLAWHWPCGPECSHRKRDPLLHCLCGPHAHGLPAAKRLARGVSERGGGLRLVESMALAHADGVVEVACNLLGGGEGVPPSDVQVCDSIVGYDTME